MDVEFKCPSCDQILTVDDSEAGLEIDCPSCEESIMLFFPDNGDEVPVDLDDDGDIEHAEDFDHAPDLSSDDEESSTKKAPGFTTPPPIKPPNATSSAVRSGVESEMDPEEIQLARKLAESAQLVRDEVAKAIVGQEDVIEQLIIAIFARSHCLLEGVPGLAKTYMIRSLSEALSFSFHRVQFTPDLMPADITGTDVIQEDPATGRRKLVFLKGPIFAQMILADEINRSPPKTQAALLEAMQEHSVTVGGKTFPLEEPFFVLATQNPVEQEGTYPLPEAQLDRFLLKIRIDYPSRDEEREILDRMARTTLPQPLKAVASSEDILRAREIINEIHVDERLKDYIVDLVCATRKPSHYKIDADHLIELGASPRGTIALALASKAHAFLNGRDYITPQDIKSVAPDVLRHRVAVSFEAEARNLGNDEVVELILNSIPVP